jgi:REP element-mobilizing transposase RayT
MTRPRAHLVDAQHRGVYHVISRCVRRAWLCGQDPLTLRSFDHRRQWIEDRVLYLAQRFAVAVHAYAVMSNHYHIVLEIDPLAPLNWDDSTIAQRWLELYPPKRWLEESVDFSPDLPEVKAILEDPQRLVEYRSRLGSLSWFMRLINEPLARLANREDGCTGRFWEGRFKSSALLDEAALVAASVYVDLNPVRAGITQDPEQGPHTSIRHRVASAKTTSDSLVPLATTLHQPVRLPFSLHTYRALARHTASRSELPGRRARHALRALNVDTAAWGVMVDTLGRHGRSVFGRPHHLADYINRTGQCWVRGMRSAA